MSFRSSGMFPSSHWLYIFIIFILSEAHNSFLLRTKNCIFILPPSIILSKSQRCFKYGCTDPHNACFFFVVFFCCFFVRMIDQNAFTVFDV